jgi:hypothetical protein
VALALAAKLLLPSITSAAAKYAPAAAACCVLATASNKTALAAGVVQAAGLGVAAWVFAWHAAALALGYAGARALGGDERLARTAAIQVGGRVLARGWRCSAPAPPQHGACAAAAHAPRRFPRACRPASATPRLAWRWRPPAPPTRWCWRRWRSACSRRTCSAAA